MPISFVLLLLCLGCKQPITALPGIPDAPSCYQMGAYAEQYSDGYDTIKGRKVRRPRVDAVCIEERGA